VGGLSLSAGLLLVCVGVVVHMDLSCVSTFEDVATSLEVQMRIILSEEQVKDAIVAYLTEHGRGIFYLEDIKDLLFVTPGEKLEFRFTELKVVLDATR